MNLNDVLTLLFIAGGCFFFLSGTVGLLRLPDVFTRLHALTKADNLGLGLIMLGAVFQADNLSELVRLALIWILVMISSATVSHLIARWSLLQGQKPWEKA